MGRMGDKDEEQLWKKNDLDVSFSILYDPPLWLR